jgi:hypothetical protein
MAALTAAQQHVGRSAPHLHGDTLRKSPEKTAKRHKLDTDTAA